MFDLLNCEMQEVLYVARSVARLRQDNNISNADKDEEVFYDPIMAFQHGLAIEFESKIQNLNFSPTSTNLDEIFRIWEKGIDRWIIQWTMAERGVGQLLHVHREMR